MLALFTVVVKALFVPLRPSYPRFLCLLLFFSLYQPRKPCIQYITYIVRSDRGKQRCADVVRKRPSLHAPSPLPQRLPAHRVSQQDTGTIRSKSVMDVA